METFDRVRDILCEQLDIESDEVTTEASILDDLGADSLDVVDLVMNLEEAFDTEIPDEDIEQLKTVGTWSATSTSTCPSPRQRARNNVFLETTPLWGGFFACWRPCAGILANDG